MGSRQSLPVIMMDLALGPEGRIEARVQASAQHWCVYVGGGRVRSELRHSPLWVLVFLSMQHGVSWFPIAVAAAHWLAGTARGP